MHWFYYSASLQADWCCHLLQLYHSNLIINFRLKAVTHCSQPGPSDTQHVLWTACGGILEMKTRRMRFLRRAVIHTATTYTQFWLSLYKKNVDNGSTDGFLMVHLNSRLRTAQCIPDETWKIRNPGQQFKSTFFRWLQWPTAVCWPCFLIHLKWEILEAQHGENCTSISGVWM